MTLQQMTLPGLHDFLASEVLPQCRVRNGGRVLDLGAGSGAWAARLQDEGYEITAVDRNARRYQGAAAFTPVDLNEPDFSAMLPGGYDLITAIELIEHLESPIGFLRNLARLLSDEGDIVLTTPNVDSAPARAKFLLTGKLRSMDEHGDPTHISPVFLWTFVNRWLPRAGLELTSRRSYPEGTFLIGRPIFTQVFRMLAPLLRHGALAGDVHVMVLQKWRGAGDDSPPTVNVP